MKRNILNYLLHKKIDLNTFIKNKYDDLWFFQLLAIDERHHLLRNNKNATLKLMKEIKANINFREALNDFINQNGENVKPLVPFIKKLKIDNRFIPAGRNTLGYLIDVLYFICANDY